MGRAASDIEREWASERWEGIERPYAPEGELEAFQDELARLGYRFQFVTLAGFHSLNHSMWELARGYRERSIAAFADLQERELAAEREGFTATRHQRLVGAGYFDDVAEVIAGGSVSTGALAGSTEEARFE